MSKSKTSSEAKRRWNKATYKRYEISIAYDSILHYKLEKHREAGGSVSDLVKNALAAYLGISDDELAFPFVWPENQAIANAEREAAIALAKQRNSTK